MFYFDETYHTRKITYKNKKLNIKNEQDFYVGCYIGSTEWNEIEKEVLELEKEYKQKLCLQDTQELKSTSLINGNKLPYGICSMSKLSVEFYTKLLSILNNRVKIHISILDKYEFLLKNILPPQKELERQGIIYRPFIYSLTKFITIHPQYNIIEILISNDKNRTKRRKIVRILKKHITKIDNIEKKNYEKNAIEQLITIFEQFPLHFNDFKDLKWDYNQSIALFKMFLYEQNINIKHLYIDEEKDTFMAAQYLFKEKTSTINSEENICIRICDWIATLISRTMLSYSKDYMNAPLEEEFSETVHLLDKKCFDINNNTKELILQMIDVLLLQQDKYWSTAGSLYLDNATEFYTVLKYFDYCFKNNETPTPEEYNKYLSYELECTFNELVQYIPS